VDKLIENSKQQKKALMQQLLTGKKRLPGFSGEWKEVRLGKVATINPKKSAKPEDGLVSFLPMEAVSETAQLLSLETKKYEEVSKGFSAFSDGDVLVAKITPCFENGKGAYVTNLTNGIGFGSTEFHVIRTEQELSSRFIYYITNSYEFRFRGEANMQGSAGQRRVPTDFLRAYPIALPPIDEQKAICSILDAVSLTIDKLSNKKEVLTHAKQALMQQLLTGKRRVTVGEHFS
jgi:type I restriction enzyme S subunit